MPVVYWSLRDESRISSANPSTLAIWRDLRVKDPLTRFSIPLSSFLCHSLIDKGMKNSEASGCLTAQSYIAMPSASFSANASSPPSTSTMGLTDVKSLDASRRRRPVTAGSKVSQLSRSLSHLSSDRVKSHTVTDPSWWPKAIYLLSGLYIRLSTHL